MRTRDMELQIAELRRCLRRAIQERNELWLELAASRAREQESQARFEQLRIDVLRMKDALRDAQAKQEQVDDERHALLRELVQRDATAAQLREARVAQEERLRQLVARNRELSDQVIRQGRELAEYRRQLTRWQEHASRLEAEVREASGLVHAAHDERCCLEHNVQVLRAQLSAAQASLKAADTAYHRAMDDLAREHAVQRHRLLAEAYHLSERARIAEAECRAARETLDNWALRLQRSRTRELVAVTHAERDAAARIERALAESERLRDALGFVSEVMSSALRRACGRAAPVALRAALSAARLAPSPDGVSSLRERMAERLMALLESSSCAEPVAVRLPAACAVEPPESKAPP